jgi:hypothetical protein
MKEPVRYIITTHRGRDGVRLSRPMNWTNEPFPNDAQAEAYAAIDAAREHRPFTIEREHVNKVLKEFRQ